MKRMLVLFFLILSGLMASLDFYWEGEVYRLNEVNGNIDLDKSISQVKEDDNGYLWMPSNHGLYRVFGEHIRIFNSYNSPLLLDKVLDVGIDDDKVWFINEFDHLYYYNGMSIETYNLKEIFNREYIKLEGVEVSEEGVVYIASNIGLIEYREGLFRISTLFSGKINNIKSVGNGILFITTGDRSYFYDDTHKKIIEEVKVEDIVGIKVEGTELLLYTDKDLYFYDYLGKMHKIYHMEKGIIQEVVIHNRYGTLVVGNNEVIALMDGREYYKQTLDMEIYHIYTTKDGIVWFVTDRGIYYLDNNLPAVNSFYIFNKEYIRSVKDVEVIEGNIYAATGLMGFYKKCGGIWRKVSNSYSIGITSDENYIYLLTKGDGVEVYERGSDKYISTIKDGVNNINGIEVVGKFQYIWSGNEIRIVDKRSEDNMEYLYSVNGQEEYIEDIIVDKLKPERLWLTIKNHGLVSLELDGKKIIRENIEDVDFEIKSLYLEDSTFYLIDKANNLYSYDLDQKKLELIYDEKVDEFSSILVDDRGIFWLGGEKGLWSLDINEGKKYLLTQQDNIQVGRFENSVVYKKDGVVYFGGTDGLNYFNPNRLVKETSDFDIKFLTLRLLNQNKLYDIGNTKKVMLDKEENSIELEFDNNSYQQRSGKFYVKLEGIDRDWVEVKNNSVVYSRLPKGNYALKLRYSYYEGDLIEKEKQLLINILPAWWESDRAYQIYFFTFVILIIAFYLFKKRSRRTKLDNKLTNMLVELNSFRTLEGLSIEFLQKVKKVLGVEEVQLDYTLLPENKTYSYSVKNHNIESNKKADGVRVDESIPKNAINIMWDKKVVYYTMLLGNTINIYFRISERIHGRLTLYNIVKDEQREISKLISSLIEKSINLWEGALTFEKLVLDANIDPLTQVYNRRYLENLLKYEHEAFRKYKRGFAVVLLDIDYFKKINDTFGHDIGDIALKQFSSLILKHIDKDDTFGRYGGEEFILVLGGKSREEVEKKSFELLKVIEEASLVEEKSSLKVTASIGVSYVDAKHKRVEEILKEADISLYEAKKAGRNRVVIAK